MKNKSRNITIQSLSNDREVLLSYGVPVAAFIPGRGYIKTDKRYSVTTSKHANEYCRQNGRADVVEVSESEFRQLISSNELREPVLSWRELIQTLEAAGAQVNFPDDLGTLLSWTSDCGDFALTRSDVDACTHAGDCDRDVAIVLKKSYVKAQLDKMSSAAIRRELSEYGAWEREELRDDDANRARFVWVMAGNMREEYRSSRDTLR